MLIYPCQMLLIYKSAMNGLLSTCFQLVHCVFGLLSSTMYVTSVIFLVLIIQESRSTDRVSEWRILSLLGFEFAQLMSNLFLNGKISQSVQPHLCFFVNPEFLIRVKYPGEVSILLTRTAIRKSCESVNCIISTDNKITKAKLKNFLIYQLCGGTNS